MTGKLLEIFKSPIKLGAYAILGVVTWGLLSYGGTIFKGGKQVFDWGVTYARIESDIKDHGARIGTLERRAEDLSGLSNAQYSVLIDLRNSLCLLTLETAKSEETKKQVCARTQIKP